LDGDVLQDKFDFVRLFRFEEEEIFAKAMLHALGQENSGNDDQDLMRPKSQ
jgi:hypothetical protein